MTEERIRYFFCHLQKTAGTSLFRRLERQFGARHLYPGPGDGTMAESVLSVPHLLERWRARRDDVDVVTGHFPLCTRELLGARFITFTLLREPVERTLSYLRHHRRLIASDRDKPLEAIYDDPFRFQGLIQNHMVKMLSLTTDEMRGGALTRVSFTRERLARAKSQLETVDVVGIQEEFESFCAELRDRLGFGGLGQPVMANRTSTFPVSPEFRARIARDNAHDAELYRFARELIAHRRASTA